MKLVDPLDGRRDIERRVLRTVSPMSFAEDPLRLVRGLRFVSQLGFELDEQTRAQMVEEAGAVRLVSGERIGGGLAADGMGELSKLLLGVATTNRMKSRHGKPARPTLRSRRYALLQAITASLLVHSCCHGPRSWLHVLVISNLSG